MLSRILLLALSLSAAPAQTLFQQVDEILHSLSGITGWKVRRKIPSEMLSKDTFRRYVESSIKASSAKEIRAEEITLKMFGFVPQDFNLARETVDLVSEQAAAYYDYNKKRLFILDSTAEGMEQRVALAHELAHALADQHHPLGKYLNRGSPDDDAETARQAVMEGQATWLAWAYIAQRNGGKAEVPPAVIDELTKTIGAESPEFPVFDKEPLYMRESLVFPYNAGLRFQDAIYRRQGRASFDGLFTHPPVSTQQIMHPEAYLVGKLPLDPRPPPLETAMDKKQARRFRLLGEGSMGEFDHNVLLRQYVGDKEGAEAASHWRGGNFKLYEHKRDRFPVLSYISEWDSPASARRIFELYQRVIRGRSKKMEIVRNAADEVSGSCDTGRFRLWISGTTVQSIEGLR